jgi:transcriptional regulator with XRE-family HTH domain
MKLKYQLAHEIEALKADRGMNQTELAAAAGIDSATLSRVRAGVRPMTFEDVALLRRAFNNVGLWAARLLAARLRDECHGPGAKQVSITVDGATAPSIMHDESPDYFGGLPPKVEKAMLKISAHCGSDPKLRDMILFLAEHLPEK